MKMCGEICVFIARWREWFYCGSFGVIASTNVLHMIYASPLPQTIPCFDAKLWKLKTNITKKNRTKYILSLDIEATGDTIDDTAESERIIYPLLKLRENFMCFWVTGLCDGCTLHTSTMRQHGLCRRAMNRSPLEGAFKWIIFSAWCVDYFLLLCNVPAAGTLHYSSDGLLCFGTSYKH